jgi:hypothetical protein
MRCRNHILCCFIFLSFSAAVFSQQEPETDSGITVISSKAARKFMAAAEGKINRYYNRIHTKTERTLEKLSRWENKIKKILQQANPQAAASLFGNPERTFSGLLEKYRNSRESLHTAKTAYSEYADKLKTSFQYLEKSPLNRGVQQVRQQLDSLEEQAGRTAAVEKFIKERKRLLMTEAAKYLAQSKYLLKINKEAYYFTESLLNYRELFDQPHKAEACVIKILLRIDKYGNNLQRQFGLFPEGCNKVFSFLGSSQFAFGKIGKLVEVFRAEVAHFMFFPVGPQVFDRIEFRCVWRKPF